MEALSQWIKLLRKSTYNKPAKDQGGIIGFSRRKEDVAQWNIIKHEKAKFTNHLRELCCLTEGDEYSLHHEFSSSLIEVDEKCVEQIVSYIAERNNPFDTGTSRVTNIVTGKEVDTETVSFLINCIKNGEECYDDYRTTRLLNKTKKLFDPIKKVNKTKRVSLASKKIDVKKETISAIRSIDYARLRDYSIAELLKFDKHCILPDERWIFAEIHKIGACKRNRKGSWSHANSGCSTK